MPTTTSLNLQALLKTASARTGMDQAASRVRGLSPSAQAMYVAVQSSHRSNSLTMVVVATDEDVDRVTSDVRFFIGALEGASGAALEGMVRPFPSLQTDPYRKLAPHFHIASARAAALHGLVTGTARVVVASGDALLPKLSDPDRLRSSSLELKPGMDLGPIDLGDLLTDAGFTREDPVDQHGEFCVRGGIVDWFPAGADYPIRVEFIGDNVESIRRYDPATQRSIVTLDQATVVPLTEKTEQGSFSTFFDYAGTRDLTLIVSEGEDVAAQVRRLEEQLSASYEEARVEDNTAPSPEELFVTWDELAPRFARAT